jgi:ABC-type transport system involved in multi-copper enzyme maturation permease subunit
MAGERAPGLATPFAQWSIISRSQIRHYLRTYRFLGLLSFVGIVSAGWLILLVASGRGIAVLNFLNSDSEFLTDYAQTLPVWIILAAAFFGGDALSVDFHSGSGYYTLVLPVDRGTMLAGRFTSALVVTLAIAAVYDLVGLLGATFAFGPGSLPWSALGVSFGLTVLFAGAVLSVAFCFSALFDTPATGVITTILVLFVGLSTIQGIVQLAGFEPWWSLYYAGGSIANVLDWQFVAHQSIPAGGGRFLQSWSATASEGALIMVAYIAVFLALSLILYQRRESTG